MSEIPFKLFYRPDEIANIVGISLRTVYRMIDDDKIKAIKIGRNIRIEREEFLRIIRSNLSQVS
jgi:excisionase family DNA binding protein